MSTSTTTPAGLPGTRRAFVNPEPNDTLTTIAARLFPGDDEGARRLLSWNLHLATRRGFFAESTGPGLLCTDIVYVEAPLP